MVENENLKENEQDEPISENIEIDKNEESKEEVEVNEVDTLNAKIDELNDKLMRLMAEFENYRKRNEKEKAQMFEVGASTVILKMLSVVDNFERGLSLINEKSTDVEGFTKIYKQLVDELSSLDVKPIEATGKKFDVNYHNAVLHIDDENIEENIVVEELQKGYTYKEKVIRYSMVKVAN